MRTKTLRFRWGCQRQTPISLGTIFMHISKYSGRDAGPRVDNPPGPGQYDLKRATALLSKSRTVKMSPRPSTAGTSRDSGRLVFQIADSPGPAYVNPALPEHGGARRGISLGDRKAWLFQGDGSRPGPGAYSVPVSTIGADKRKGFRMGSARKGLELVNKDQLSSPGPAQYGTTVSATSGHDPRRAINFGGYSDRGGTIDTGVPGPGGYNTTISRTVRSHGFGRTKPGETTTNRLNFQPSDSPGPQRYNTAVSSFDRPRNAGITLHSKKPWQTSREEGTPGPGAYHVPAPKSARAVSIGTKRSKAGPCPVHPYRNTSRSSGGRGVAAN